MYYKYCLLYTSYACIHTGIIYWTLIVVHVIYMYIHKTDIKKLYSCVHNMYIPDQMDFVVHVYCR